MMIKKFRTYAFNRAGKTVFHSPLCYYADNAMAGLVTYIERSGSGVKRPEDVWLVNEVTNRIEEASTLRELQNRLRSDVEIRQAFGLVTISSEFSIFDWQIENAQFKTHCLSLRDNWSSIANLLNNVPVTADRVREPVRGQFHTADHISVQRMIFLNPVSTPYTRVT